MRHWPRGDGSVVVTIKITDALEAKYCLAKFQRLRGDTFIAKQLEPLLLAEPTDRPGQGHRHIVADSFCIALLSRTAIERVANAIDLSNHGYTIIVF